MYEWVLMDMSISISIPRSSKDEIISKYKYWIPFWKYINRDLLLFRVTLKIKDQD